MTKFVYFSDTHLGKEPNGFQQQQSYPESVAEILQSVQSEIKRRGDIDFILHGGDMIHTTTDEDILRISELVDWGIPVYLCLGNHDLTSAGALERWLTLVPHFFIDASPEYTIETPDCLIHVTPNHWGEKDYFWEESQRARFSAKQLQDLEEKLQAHPDLPHFLSTHSPVFGLPVEQSGLETPIHVPDPSFTHDITSLANHHPNLRCVLGAHSHLNMRVSYAQMECVTVSSLIEAPFEYKVFEVNEGTIKMTTHRLGSEVLFSFRYNQERAFVQGRESDRTFQRS